MKSAALNKESKELMNIIKKLTHWLLFTVIISLLPIIFNGLMLISETGITDDIFEKLFSRGDILIVAVCIYIGCFHR